MEQVKINPKLYDVLDEVRRQIMIDLNCHAIAKIEKVDYENQTVDAQIAYDKTILVRNSNGDYDKTFPPYSLLVKIPFVHLRGGKTGLSLPIQVGDDALIIFNDRDYSNWYRGSNKGGPPSNRLHNMSDAIAIVGLSSKISNLSQYDNTNPVLYNEQTKVTVKKDKVKIENSSDSLGVILAGLVSDLSDLSTQISSLTVTITSPGNPSSVPINKPAFDALKIKFDNTKTKLQGLLE